MQDTALLLAFHTLFIHPLFHTLFMRPLFHTLFMRPRFLHPLILPPNLSDIHPQGGAIHFIAAILAPLTIDLRVVGSEFFWNVARYGGGSIYTNRVSPSLSDCCLVH